MAFQPNPGDVITIDDELYHFADHPSGPGFVYAQEARRATVYQLKSLGGTAHAFKVFKEKYAKPQIAESAHRIKRFHTLAGLRVCERKVLTPNNSPELLKNFPDLQYSVLMPWIDGDTWQGSLIKKAPMDKGQSRTIAAVFSQTMKILEEKSIAHCDLSGANIIVVTPQGKGSGNLFLDCEIALVDVEDLYSPTLSRPEILSAGSPGYGHKIARNGLWSANADRFAGAVLLAEMLGWSDSRIVNASYGDHYFATSELQEQIERYQIMKLVLAEKWGNQISILFEDAWRSKDLSECPTFQRWLEALTNNHEENKPARSIKWNKNFVSFRTAVSKAQKKGQWQVVISLCEEVSLLPNISSDEIFWFEQKHTTAIRKLRVKLALKEKLALVHTERKLGYLEEAIKSLEEAVGLAPRRQGLKTELEKLKHALYIQETLELTRKALVDEKWSELSDLFSRLPPKDSRVIKLRREANRKRAEVLRQNVRVAEDKHHWIIAAKALEELEALGFSDETTTQKLTKFKKEANYDKNVADSQEALGNKNWKNAQNFANKARSLYPHRKEPHEILEEVVRQERNEKAIRTVIILFVIGFVLLAILLFTIILVWLFNSLNL